MNRLLGEIMEVRDLGKDQSSEMFCLFSVYFPGVSYERFISDLYAKEWVIVLREKLTGKIQGFSTQTIIKTEVLNEEYHALYSGDTIIARNFWGEKALMSLWGTLAFQLIENFQGKKLFWFLISMGYKTYRFLPVFFHEFYPRYDREMPAEMKRILDAFALKLFARLYDPQKGVVRMGREVALQDGIADIEPKHLKNMHIRFFASKNPNYAMGDELACIAPLEKDNLNSYAHRIIQNASKFYLFD